MNHAVANADGSSGQGSASAIASRLGRSPKTPGSPSSRILESNLSCYLTVPTLRYSQTTAEMPQDRRIRRDETTDDAEPEASSAVCRLLLALLAVVVGVIVVNENGSPMGVHHTSEMLSCVSCPEMIDTIRR